MTHPTGHHERFIRHVATTIDHASLLVPRQRVLVACSGGADSVALLGALASLAEEARRDYQLTVAHLDHGLREVSSEDAEFVGDLAREHGLACISERMDVPALAAELGEGLEHAAREARYRFFARAAEQCGASAVAVAHHADDNVETILFRILRGSALRGLAGMPIRRPLAGTRQPVDIIRPLLHCRQEQILEFLRRQGLHWREDATNDDPAYKRNFIRHELLPTIRWHINDHVDEAILRLGEFASQAEDAIGAQADTLLRKARIESSPNVLIVSATKLAAAEPIVRTTALRLAMEHLDAPQRDLSAEHFAELDLLLLQPEEATVNLPGHLQASRKGTQLHLVRQNPTPPVT